MLVRRTLLLLAVALVVTVAYAQTPPTTTKPLTFEVATIKPTARTDGHWRLQPTPDGYTGMDISLFMLIQEAYGFGFDPKRIAGGPAWVDKDKFDIEAKFDVADITNANRLTYRQRADMLRSLLADRFKLKVHYEARDFPVFNLVVAKDGAKLKESAPASLNPAEPGCHSSRNGYHGCSMSDLVTQLMYPSGRTVIDKTGLTGVYDYKLLWSSENTPADSPAAAYPSIFTAVQEQLGLKLEPATAPINTLVIDSAEKPSEN